MGIVTVIGVGGSVVNLPFAGADATSLAQSLANVINGEAAGGALLLEAKSSLSATLVPSVHLSDLVVGTTSLTPTSAGDKSVLGKASDFQASTGADTIVATDRSGLSSGAGVASGSANVTGGAANLSFIAAASGNTVVGGTGSETIFGGSGNSSSQGGSGGNNYIMGAGTLIGGGNETLSAALSSGNDTFVAGTGNATITAGMGADLLKIINGASGGHDLLLGFGGADSVSLAGYSANEASNALAKATQGASGLTVTLSDNTQITFAGVTNPNSIHFT